jgi:DNA-binding response OmpR family regulator
MSSAGGKSRRKRVLLVEDDPDQLVIRCLLLERKGFACLTAADAGSALRIAAEEQPDCVVMDLRVPGEQDGISLIQSLKALLHSPAIILLTGRQIGPLRTRPGFEQIASFIEKGSPTAELLEAVTRACG